VIFVLIFSTPEQAVLNKSRVRTSLVCGWENEV